ncbi:MAG: segregation and condensation protein B [Rhizobiales bacterium 35-66-30]|nr:MAG: segregation and condensation protein B [Rhizobiales bacterium 35-66-30]
MARRTKTPVSFDVELSALPPELRWREWMGRVEAVIFAAPEPVTREVLARVVGRDCSLDHLIDDIRAELTGRPYDLVAVAGGWQHRTRKNFAEAIQVATGLGADNPKPLSQSEALVLLCIGYFQPITRGELSTFFGKEISRDVIGHLRSLGFIAPDMEALEDAGLLSKDMLLAGDIPLGLMAGDTDDGEPEEVEADEES